MARELSPKDLLNLTPELAAEIFAQGEEAVTWALLHLAALAKGKPDYKSKVARIHKRLDTLTSCDTWTKPDCKRLRKRLIKFRDSLFTFLDDPAVPFDTTGPKGKFDRQ